MEMLDFHEIKYLVYFCGAIGITATVYLLYHCSSEKKTIFNFKLFKIRSLRISFIINIVNSATVAFFSFALPLIFQKSFGFTPSQSGMLILPLPIAMVIVRSISDKLFFHYGFKRVIINSLFISVIAIIFLAQINSHSSIYFIMICEFIYGASFIIVNSATFTLVYVDLTPDKISIATAMDMTFRQFSASIGIGIGAFLSGYITNNFALDLYGPDMLAFRYVFYVIAAVPLIAILAVRGLNKTKGMREVLAGIDE